MHPSRPSFSRNRTRAALAAACLALLLCAPAQAGKTGRRTVRQRPPAAVPAKPVAPAVVPAPAPPAGSAAMRVAVEPETGALVPAAAEQALPLSAAERTGLMRTSEGLSEVRLADGTVMLDLQGRFMEYGVVRLDAACRPLYFPANEAHVLRALLAGRAPASTPFAEER